MNNGNFAGRENGLSEILKPAACCVNVNKVVSFEVYSSPCQSVCMIHNVHIMDAFSDVQLVFKSCYMP